MATIQNPRGFITAMMASVGAAAVFTPAIVLPLEPADSHGWYDRQFETGGQTWRAAGHIEMGRTSWSDPAGGGPGPLRLT
ncbi:hypothetical protein [uncultured Brevundimonas sp.]|uniref:hypothetical protein n=1 Tax=uncultured Brevundimonas sp. TaxID=213418 RepID=UPI00261C9155|nr:hypothetical protein [uncultured Brevundimonas sp.]